MTYVVRPISDRTTFTGKHQHSQFDSTWSSTEQLLMREVSMLRGREVVLELDFTESQLRLDGRPKANAASASPCARLAFESTHGPLVYATDRFWRWQDNVRAIALGLEALRKVDRYGITKRGEQYAGWKALPAGRAMPASHMTTQAAYDLLTEILGPEVVVHADADDAALIRRARGLVHPDRRDGDRTLWDEVEQAAQVLGVAR